MKTLTRIILTSLFSLAITGVNAIADGLRIENGHYAGEIISIKLNEKQQETIKTNYEPWGDLQLTQAQRNIIKNKTKITPPPSKLVMVKIEHTIGQCSCGVSNLGLIIEPDLIEIPIKYIYTDEEAELRRIE